MNQLKITSTCMKNVQVKHVSTQNHLNQHEKLQSWRCASYFPWWSIQISDLSSWSLTSSKFMSKCMMNSLLIDGSTHLMSFSWWIGLQHRWSALNSDQPHEIHSIWVPNDELMMSWMMIIDVSWWDRSQISVWCQLLFSSWNEVHQNMWSMHPHLHLQLRVALSDELSMEINSADADDWWSWEFIHELCDFHHQVIEIPRKIINLVMKLVNIDQVWVFLMSLASIYSSTSMMRAHSACIWWVHSVYSMISPWIELKTHVHIDE